MTNAEKLAGARKFLATPNLGRDMARELNKALAYMWELADIAEAAEARVKGFEANFPCDGGCNYASGPEESCSLHGRNPADLWGIIANTSAELYEAEVRIAELEAGEISALREAVARVRALETFSITDSYPAWTAVDHDDLLAALDGVPEPEVKP